MFWHVKSFRDYIRDIINPLGLRVHIFPTLDDLDSDFKQKWEQILQTCSRNLMETLIDEYTKRSKALDTEIIGLCGKLNNFKTHTSMIVKETKLKTHLETFNKEILIKKGQKLIRDKNAFEAVKANKWSQNKHSNKGNPNREPHQNSH